MPLNFRRLEQHKGSVPGCCPVPETGLLTTARPSLPGLRAPGGLPSQEVPGKIRHDL